ncbi:MAG: ATP-dependent zinc metalloprotease yme1l1 [Marteilia pararefringens]
MSGQVYYPSSSINLINLSSFFHSDSLCLEKIADAFKLSCSALKKMLRQKHSKVLQILKIDNQIVNSQRSTLPEICNIPIRQYHQIAILKSQMGLKKDSVSEKSSILRNIYNHNFQASYFHTRAGGGTQIPFQRKINQEPIESINSPSLYESLKDVKDSETRAKIIDSVAKLFSSNKSQNNNNNNKQTLGNSDLIFLRVLKYIFAAGGFLTLYTFFHNQPTTITSKNIFPASDTTDYIKSERSNVMFDDVCGIEEAKVELNEIVNFLENPQKYSVLGAKLPKGVLLHGPPGNGKTLLAKAVSGQASVPFFHISGSQFDEQFVGVGAKRVRELFKKASDNAPCVIFIDEIDSVGAKRTSADLYPYANQTINQLLAELDGFIENSGVIVIGATNRPDNLDKALLRPGRFDTLVYVGHPDITGRKELFKHYSSKIRVDPKLLFDKISRQTAGFSAAEIYNVVNQAALRAALKDKAFVDEFDFAYAYDKITMGAEKKNKIPDPEINWNTAIHEAGHALAAYYTPGSASLNKITILSRGSSLGHTSFVSNNEFTKTKKEMFASVDVALGGRAAEELIFGPDNITTGCANDLKQANSTLSNMVVNLGMDSNNTLRSNSDKKHNDIIEKELNSSYSRVSMILQEHKEELIAVAQCLMQYETLNIEQFEKILSRKTSKKQNESLVHGVSA